MSTKVVMGIDTSNYTTSVALISLDGKLIANIKEPLPVKPGERGLRQSDAVFAHIKNLPIVMKKAQEQLNGKSIVAVGVSEKPRNVVGSYMPCFLCGVAAKESVIAASAAKGYSFSHQCGHIMAALYGSGHTEMLNESFVAFHISGGTTEMLKVTGNGRYFECDLIGGTSDLNAGQVIDRIGVYMGLAFPAGREMEALALANVKKIPVRIPKVSGYEFNLSGLENLAKKIYDDSGDKELTAAFVFEYVASVLVSVCNNYEALNGKTKFVFAGGVMSNSIIKEILKNHFEAFFAEPQLSADNAVGIAVLAKEAYCLEN